MSPAQKANREPAPPEVPEFKQVSEKVAAHYSNGVDRLAEAQKNCIDLAVQHELESVDLWKELALKWPGVSRIPMLDLVANSLERFAEVQKSAIDFVVEQNRSLTGLWKEGASALESSKDSTTNLLQQTMERTVATQKRILDQSANQTKAVFDATRQQFGFTGGRAEAVADSFHRGVDTIVEAQKDLLDVVTH